MLPEVTADHDRPLGCGAPLTGGQHPHCAGRPAQPCPRESGSAARSRASWPPSLLHWGPSAQHPGPVQPAVSPEKALDQRGGSRVHLPRPRGASSPPAPSGMAGPAVTEHLPGGGCETSPKSSSPGHRPGRDSGPLLPGGTSARFQAGVRLGQRGGRVCAAGRGGPPEPTTGHVSCGWPPRGNGPRRKGGLLCPRGQG